MKSMLLAVAVVGVLAANGASAGTTNTVADRNTGFAGFVPVQYSYGYPDRSDERAMTIDQREAHLRARIERGMHDGRITNYEARRLYRELASIESKERAFKADGRLDWREDASLKRDLDRLADNVRIQLRDDDRRYSYNSPYNSPYNSR